MDSELGNGVSSTLSVYMRRFFSGTLLSRISGMARDLAIAFAFGDHTSLAAFMVAFRIANLFRRLIGEGPFQSAFIPYFERIRTESPQRAVFFFTKLTSFVFTLLVALIALTEIVLWIATSCCSLSADNIELLSLTGWVLPGLLFIGLYGLNISFLHCHDSFFIPSFAPFISNAVWIMGALFLRHQEPSSAMVILAKLVVIGFFGQWLVTVPLTLRYASVHVKEWLTIELPPEVKGLARSFALGALGVGATQINAFMDAIFARYADLKGPIYLWYSIRLEQLVLAIFGIACISTIVPRLSRAIKSGDVVEAHRFFSFSFKRILAVMIPSTFAIFVLGGPSINLLYGRGIFSSAAVSHTTLCLWSYTLGLIPTTMVILFSSLFYARSDFKTPMLASFATILCNSLLNILFVFGLEWGATSTALATSASAWCNCWILAFLSRKEGWELDYPISKIIQLAIASSFASLVVIITHFFFVHPTPFALFVGHSIPFPRDFISQIRDSMLPAILFVASLWIYATFFKMEDLVDLFQEFSLLRRSKPSLSK